MLILASSPPALTAITSPLLLHRWSPHDEKGQGPLAYLTFFWKPLLQYLVFPVQFLFLYSYHPTGGMGDLPKQLEVREAKKLERLG